LIITLYYAKVVQEHELRRRRVLEQPLCLL
jgi:hypothetical protein